MNKDIIVAGDLHGNWGAINTLINKKQPKMILQVGDFGWFPNFEVKKPVIYNHQVPWKLKGIKTNDTKIYFCDGNHENHEFLIQDGQIYELYENVYHCSRGSILGLPDGRKVLFIGGAESIDKDQRLIGHDWFPGENIQYGQLANLLYNEANIKKIDIIISHTCPFKFDILTENEFKLNDGNRKILDEILDMFSPDYWYFGHWHRYIKGQYKNTKYFGLDYPRKNATWWKYLD
jgi:hypothetical protein